VFGTGIDSVFQADDTNYYLNSNGDTLFSIRDSRLDSVPTRGDTIAFFVVDGDTIDSISFGTGLDSVSQVDDTFYFTNSNGDTLYAIRDSRLDSVSDNNDTFIFYVDGVPVDTVRDSRLDSIATQGTDTANDTIAYFYVDGNIVDSIELPKMQIKQTVLNAMACPHVTVANNDVFTHTITVKSPNGNAYVKVDFQGTLVIPAGTATHHLITLRNVTSATNLAQTQLTGTAAIRRTNVYLSWGGTLANGTYNFAVQAGTDDVIGCSGLTEDTKIVTTIFE